MIGLVIHNPDHRRLVQALEMVGLLNPDHDVAMLSPNSGQSTMGLRLNAIIVVDAPDHHERSSQVWMAGYREWLNTLELRFVAPGLKITYLHPAGEPM